MEANWKQDTYDDGSPARSVSVNGVSLNAEECNELLILLSDINKVGDFGSFNDIIKNRINNFCDKLTKTIKDE